MSTNARDHAIEAATIMTRAGEGAREYRHVRAAEAQAHALTALALSATVLPSLIYVVEMEANRFSFMAAGSTEERAITAMVETMRRHREQAGPETWQPGYYAGAVDRFGYEYPEDDSDLLRWLITEWYSARVIPLRPDAAGARDGEAAS
jgi:hypothetical protein